ncbi:MAG TPA: hypothetical protein VD788_03515 [Candidatus Polarisedimenticolaceae bacterium]|nr:hypothetical protein [Candidatus Polarisedimenticolaceae bacterium]
MAPFVDRPITTLAGGEHLARERLSDGLGARTIAGVYQRAALASGRSAAEGERRPFRALAALYLDRATREPDDELARIRAASGADPAEETGWMLEPDPVARRRALAASIAREDRESRWMRDRIELRERAARDAGATSVVGLLDAAQPRASAAIAREFERDAIEPLDEAISAAARQRRQRFGLDPDENAASETPAFLSMAALAGRLPATAIHGVVRRVGTRFGEDPDSAGPHLAPRPAPGPRSFVGLTRDGLAVIVAGAVAGPGGLRDLLGSFGVAARAGRIADLRGTAAVRFADPAFAHASSTLWRRLPLCPRFRREAGLDADDWEIRELAFQEAVAMRLAWAYLQTAVTGIDGSSPAFDRIVRRSCGAAATPAERRAVADRDPSWSAQLRGNLLGLLLEQRLRLRYGRDWFSRNEARRFLVEMWEAEPEMTAEEMAGSLDLGTIEATPMVDAFRDGVAG